MLRLRISSESDATRSLIAASRFARDLGFPQQDRQVISVAVSELAGNILKHAGQGQIVIEETEADGRTAVQIIASDRGPGIENVEIAMRGRVGADGTPGLGLSGVKRLLDDFEIESAPGQGTRVVVRKWCESRVLLKEESETGIGNSNR